jgi:acetyl-CoA acetyltransferase
MREQPVGIVSFSACIPRYRLSREAISREWQEPPAKGEKAVPCFDEDTITTAFEAATNCIEGPDPARLRAQLRWVTLATTTPPYHEKLGAGLLSTELDLDRQCRTAGSANTLRAAASAILSGIDAINAGAAGCALVADTRDRFTNTEILNYEDLLFVEKGKGGRLIEEGYSALHGKLPVNPGDGLKSSGRPIGATGVPIIYEIKRQLQNRLGERQVKGARVGPAHNLGGPGAVGCVTILASP